METLVKAFVGACGTGLLTLIIICIKFMYKKMTADTLTLKAVIHNAYFNQCKVILHNGTKTRADVENFEHLYAAYKAQGLNGTGDEMHDLVKEVPLEKDSI